MLILTLPASITFSMEQTEKEYIPPVTIGSLLNTTDYTIELTMNNETIVSVKPKKSEYSDFYLPLSKETFTLDTPWIYVNADNQQLLRWIFHRDNTIANEYTGYISWGTIPEKRVLNSSERVNTSYDPGQTDSYEINMTFAGKQLEDTKFDIAQTIHR